MKKKISLIQRLEYLKEISTGKKVLHLGCTNYPYTDDSLNDNSLLHLELAKVAADLYGFDFDQRGLDILAARGVQKLYAADLENLDQVGLDEKFDVIIAGEMIEHLSNPGLFVKGIKRFMSPRTYLVITTINAYCGLRFALYALRGKGGENEPVHPDHVAYYSFKTLSLILSREDMFVNDFFFYDLGPEHRVHLPWYYNFVNDICVKVSPQLADGVIALCQLSEESLN
jgi:SAM-dependent methyltransferase